jgi:4-hydroxythreonine-4-phosphate dehydrogenase
VTRRVAAPTIAITSGEPAGIGPDLCSELSRRCWPARLVVIGDATLNGRARTARSRRNLPAYDPAARVQNRVESLHVPLAAPCRPGRLDPRNARYVLDLLDRAVTGCTRGEFAAMVTAPVQKSVIIDAGFRFSGHTEYLAERTRSLCPVMMLTGAGLRVALVTTHLPLARVSRALTAKRIQAVIEVLEHDLRERYRIRRPRLLICGVNPHAGESGHLGREEITQLEPTLARLRRRGFRLEGPVPADTAFLPGRLEGCDVVLAMYHDQGLPVLKFASFGHAVNVTLGLPIVRTSVDHGTALELAGTTRADPGSLHAAIDHAIELARRAS